MKRIIIKYGGSVQLDQNHDFVNQIKKLQNEELVIVHGGGKEISKLLEKLEIKSQFKDGYRVSSENVIEVAQYILNGKANKDITSKLLMNGVKAIGLSGQDGILKANIKLDSNNNATYGRTGDIKSVQPTILEELLKLKYVPVISPLANDDNFEPLNINSDLSACFIAKALKAHILIFLSDIPGILDKDNNILHLMNIEKAKELIEKKIISGGMIPKVEACIDCVQNGITEVHIINPKNMDKQLNGDLVGTKFSL